MSETNLFPHTKDEPDNIHDMIEVSSFRAGSRRNIIEKINATLTHQKVEDPSRSELIHNIDEYFKWSEIYEKHMDKFLQHEKIKWTNDTYLAKAKRKAEREDMWKLFIDRSIRWVLGGLITFLMYSLVVTLSENFPSFFKVPVRDIFINHNNP